MDIHKVVEKISERASEIPGIGKSLKILLGEHIIYIDGTGDENIVTEHEEGEADCTITIGVHDFISLVEGKLNPMMAVMSGKVKIRGDMGVAMKLQSLLKQ
jgi:acyl-CoA dehydrogenase